MRKQISISSIFEGFQPSKNFGQSNEYLAALGIDPDMPMTDDPADLKTSGFIRPVMYEAFSGEEIDATPIKVLTTPKSDKVYVILSNGKIIQYDNNLTNGTLVGQLQEASSDVPARGAWYYNNFIFIAGPTDLGAFGPMDGSPTLTNEVWTGTMLNNQPPLTDSGYPVTLFSIGYLNHHGFSHVDGCSYFLDYADGRGFIHKIQTRKNSAQGDEDDGSAFQSVGDLSLPFDYIPVTGCSYGIDVVVSGTKTTDTNIAQGGAILAFWNAADELFDRIIPLPDPICTALLYKNGVLYGLSGSLSGGYRLFRYLGGDAIETLKIIEDGYPPMQNTFEFAGDRLVWAATTTYPYNSSGIMAYGSKSGLFPNGLHHIALTSFT